MAKALPSELSRIRIIIDIEATEKQNIGFIKNRISELTVNKESNEKSGISTFNKQLNNKNLWPGLLNI